MYVPVFGEDRYTIQEIKRAWLGATTVRWKVSNREGAQGTGVGVICRYTKCGINSKTIYMWPQSNNKKISVFFHSNLIILSFMFRPLDIINTSSYD